MKKFIIKEKQRKKEMLYYNREQELVEKRFYRRMQKEKKQYQRWIPKLENEMEENQLQRFQEKYQNASYLYSNSHIQQLYTDYINFWQQFKEEIDNCKC